jgi:hypothetical protein
MPRYGLLRFARNDGWWLFEIRIGIGCMIRKSGYRFSEKIMLKQSARECCMAAPVSPPRRRFALKNWINPSLTLFSSRPTKPRGLKHFARSPSHRHAAK